ncbi:MAG: hypothetical protein AAFX85_09115 [Pseudomonadota bacterium]
MSQEKQQETVVEDKPLSVDDIPGAVAPSADGADAASDAGGSSLHNRLSAFRERRTGAPASARPGGGAARSRPNGSGRGPAGALTARRVGNTGGGARAAAQGGVGALQARRANAGGGGSNDDAAAKGKEILKQLISRMNTQGDQKPLHKALRGVARGYQALENEVQRLRDELDSYR